MGNYDNLLNGFHLEDGFTYMTDLTAETIPPRAIVPQDSHYGKAKIQLFEDASAGLLAEAKNIINPGNNIFKTALELLQNAAKSEESKEIKAIKEYKNKLEKNIPTRWKDNKEFQKAYNALMGCLNKGVNDSNIGEFQAQLIKAINLIRQDERDYKARLAQIISKERIRSSNAYKDLANDQYLFRAYSEIDTMFKEMTGIATKKSVDSFSSKLQKYVYQYASRHKLHSNKNLSTENYMAIIAAILVDIERFVQEEYNKELLKNPEAPPFEDALSDNILDQAWNNYLEAEKSQATLLQKALNGDVEEFNRIIPSFKSLLGIGKLTSKEVAQKQAKIQQLLEADKKAAKTKRGASKRNDIYKKLLSSKSIVTRNRTIQIGALTWKAKTDNSHGTLNEIAHLLIDNAFSTSQASAAEDSFTIGTVEGTIDDRKMKKEISESGKRITSAIKKYYKDTSQNKKRDRHKLFSEYYKELNNAIKKEIDDIEKDLSQSSDFPENIFVYHESLKLYSRIETGKTNEFHGREIGILSAFDRLYSLAGIDGLVLPQQNTMIAIAANLSSYAAGASAREPLEKYLSIFAGLLMFEDIRTVALNALNIELSNEHEIHLYLVNGIYVPSSVVLNNIYRTIQPFAEIGAENAARAEIDVRDADEVINKYVQERNSGKPYDDNDWDPIANAVISGTKFQITFLAGFMQLLQKLSTL